MVSSLKSLAHVKDLRLLFRRLVSTLNDSSQISHQVAVNLVLILISVSLSIKFVHHLERKRVLPPTILMRL